ncbi:PREDICTED: uncharacterized protein LOC105456351 [Wasmannia auropunctata]|uniref:uncharacterized protein LOC105456351 n=1 Tax=Wasmannia auropunctata TaxID=64793 RepID=UPI0005F04FB0|nr:PREDICTED: uncharacterized protein LOC105456351 [Wasmannia auropunctata]XP_011698615.1 PREDICTED: uncharacterized protein LOC105456351 [Wasmannia auropunctata]XP_011698616.1 PREDICTED: uncharacterized protein LOC105456351 [Wasmannia auropunctata]
MAEAQSDSIYDSIIMYYEERAKKYQMFLRHPNVRNCILRFREQLAHNPFLQVATFIAIASLLTPILLFIMFAIVSAVFIFIGFMMVQVTVLAIGASILSCVLFCIASTIIMVGLFILFVYYTLYYTNHAFNLLLCTKT